VFSGVEGDPQKRQASVGHRADRDIEAAQGVPLDIEEVKVGTSQEIDVGKNSTKAADRGGDGAVRAWYEECHICNVATDWAEQSRRTEEAESRSIRRIEFGDETAKRGLNKARAWSAERCATGVLESIKGSERDVYAYATAVLVDLTPAIGKGTGVVSVVRVSQSSAEGIHRCLD
jgi:hypothetical protein